jgi:hypothetical protein
VLIQNSSAPSSARRDSSQPIATASGSLNLSSSFVAGSLIRGSLPPSVETVIIRTAIGHDAIDVRLR